MNVKIIETMIRGDAIMEEYNNESIKTQRVKTYFIQATKDIIISEGLENATVRNIAQKAGYAVSTLYQYFEQLNQLLLEVKKSYVFDLMAEIQKHVVVESYDAEDIKAQNRAFMSFFIEQPNIYPFFYKDLDSSSMGNFDNLVFSKDYFKIYEAFSEQGIINKKDIPNIAKIIVYSMNGMMRIYFSNHGLTKEEIFEDLDNIIDFLLKKK